MEDKSPTKIRVEREIFRKDSNKPFTWKQLKEIKFKDDDRLEIGYDEGYYSENNSWDPHYYAVVYRMEEETDIEFERRQTRIAIDEKLMKKRRYESYLKLKKEFEDE